MPYMLVTTGAIGQLERRLVRGLALLAVHDFGRLPGGARSAGLSDQRHPALSSRDRLHGMGNMVDIGQAPALGGVEMAQRQPEIFDHGKRAHARRIPARQVAGTEIPLDIGGRQAGVGQGSGRHFGMKLRQRDIRRIAGRMLVGADD